MSSDKDKRRFRRYKHRADCYLSFKNTSIKAEIINYSLQGIGFLIDNPPPVTLETDVQFRIKDLQVDDEGTIIWSQKSDSQLKGGIEKKTIHGFLKYYPLADVLIDLQRTDKNGILDIREGPSIKRIYIRNGDMVFATSNKEEDRFIEILLRAGKITNDQYYQIIDIAKKKGKSPGTTLVELGYIKSEDIIWAVRHQVEEIIVSLFQWEDGNFSFIEGPLISEKVIKLKLSAANLIYRGIKKIKNPQYINNVMPPLDTILGYSMDPLDLFQDINLEKSDKDILSFVNGKRTIKEILSVSTSDPFQTMVTLYALLSTRLIDIQETGSPAEKIHEEILKEPEEEADPDFLKRVEDVYGKLSSSDYYSILGVDKWATLEKIKKSYYTAAKEFHPDKHLLLSSDTLKNKLNTIFSQLTEIYKVLSDSKLRMEYDQSLTIRPAKLQTNNVELARSIFKEGEQAFRNGSYAKAKELFGRASYLDSKVPAYYFSLGLVYAKEHKFHEAGKILNKALELDPYNSEYLAEIGYVYLHLGFTLRAKSSFEKALRSDTFNKSAIEGLQKVRDLSD